MFSCYRFFVIDFSCFRTRIFAYCRVSRDASPGPPDHVDTADDDFFHRVKTNSHHILQPYLPDQTDIPYQLQIRWYNTSLSKMSKWCRLYNSYVLLPPDEPINRITVLTLYVGIICQFFTLLHQSRCRRTTRTTRNRSIHHFNSSTITTTTTNITTQKTTSTHTWHQKYEAHHLHIRQQIFKFLIDDKVTFNYILQNDHEQNIRLWLSERESE